MREFEPVPLGAYEAEAWVAYYQRRWARFLYAAVRMVRAGFMLSWPRTVAGAWLVLRANQAWAPYPDNDPDGARALMVRFYGMVADGRDPASPSIAAERTELIKGYQVLKAVVASPS